MRYTIVVRGRNVSREIDSDSLSVPDLQGVPGISEVSIFSGYLIDGIKEEAKRRACGLMAYSMVCEKTDY